MARLTIVIGANGAGKSTWCRSSRRELPSDFYDADSIAQGLGSYDDSALQREARKWVDRRIEGQLERGESFGFEVVRHTDPLPRWFDDLVPPFEGDRARQRGRAFTLSHHRSGCRAGRSVRDR